MSEENFRTLRYTRYDGEQVVTNDVTVSLSTILSSWFNGGANRVSVRTGDVTETWELPTDVHHASPNGILTVGKLREMLAGLDPNVQVVMDDRDDWYLNVGTVIVPAPDGQGDFQCVTLVPGESFDSRQI